MKKIIAYGSFAVFLSTLAGCTNADRVPEPTLGPTAGEAVQRNIAAQVVNPTAPSGEEAITMSGERAALAESRYSRDAVRQPPEAMQDMTGISAGGSTGASAGGGGGGTP